MIIVDAFGGDNSPDEIILGACLAVKEYNENITLVGDENKIKDVFEKYNLSKDKISIVHAADVITNEDQSALSIRRKKDSTMVVGANLLKENENSVFVSAGSTGALLASTTLVAGRIKNVKRPALGVTLPARKKPILLMDCGANSECKPEFIEQFAVMASAYMNGVLNVENPKVGLINIGAEEKKGSALYQEVHGLLKNNEKINFGGNIEARYLLDSDFDVVVCDGFTGNIVLKLVEGMASFFKGTLKEVFYASIKTKLGAILIKSKLGDEFKKLDYKEYGGAPLLGVNGGVIKAHGSSDKIAIKNAIRQAIIFRDNNVVKKIEKNLS